MPNAETLLEKIQALPAARIAEIEDFVEFIAVREKEHSLVHAAAEASAPSFSDVWNNPDDDIYDTL